MKALFVVFVAALLWSGSAVADLVISVKTTDLKTGASHPGELYLAKERLRFVGPPEGGTEVVMIYQGDRDRAVILDARSEEYVILDRETGKAIEAKLNETRKALAAQLENVPPEKRAMMEQMMEESLGLSIEPAADRSIEVREFEETRDIGDFPCRRYDVIVDGTRESEVWATSWKEAGVDRDTFEVFRGMAQLFREMLADMPRLADQRKVFSGIDEIDAFPILIRDFEDESVTTETVFESIDERDVDAGLYEIPDGYSERSMFD